VRRRRRRLHAAAGVDPGTIVRPLPSIAPPARSRPRPHNSVRPTAPHPAPARTSAAACTSASSRSPCGSSGRPETSRAAARRTTAQSHLDGTEAGCQPAVRHPHRVRARPQLRLQRSSSMALHHRRPAASWARPRPPGREATATAARDVRSASGDPYAGRSAARGLPSRVTVATAARRRDRRSGSSPGARPPSAPTSTTSSAGAISGRVHHCPLRRSSSAAFIAFKFRVPCAGLYNQCGPHYNATAMLDRGARRSTRCDPELPQPQRPVVPRPRARCSPAHSGTASPTSGAGRHHPRSRSDPRGATSSSGCSTLSGYDRSCTSACGTGSHRRAAARVAGQVFIGLRGEHLLLDDAPPTCSATATPATCSGR
jgi:hypothetical protein